jgi:hypothetical protein
MLYKWERFHFFSFSNLISQGSVKLVAWFLWFLGSPFHLCDGGQQIVVGLNVHFKIKVVTTYNLVREKGISFFYGRFECFFFCKIELTN